MGKIIKNKKLLIFLVLSCIAIFYSLWLIVPGLMVGHDTLFHLSRIIGLKDSINGGDILAYIHVGLHGLGYANGLFYGNLFLYLPALIGNFIGIIGAYKILILICNIISTISMYLCVKNISKSKKAGIVSSLLYMGCSYRIIDMMVRSALGEFISFCFLPLIIWGIYEIIFGDCKKWWIFSLGFVFVLQSHIITTVLIFVNILGIIIFNFDKLLQDKNRIKYLIYSVILGLLLSSNFLFPFLEGYLKNNLLVSKDIRQLSNKTIPLERLFLDLPYFRELKYFCPPGVGILFLIIILYRIFNKMRVNSSNKFCDICIIVGIINLMCVTKMIPWNELKRFLSFIQFPWRFYIISSLFFSVSCGIIINELFFNSSKTKLEKIIKFSLIVLFSLMPYISNLYVYRYSKSTKFDVIDSFDDYVIMNGEYLPDVADKKKIKDFSDYVYTNNKNLIYSYKRSNNEIIFSYSNNNLYNTYIELPLVYYYGYKAYSLNNNKMYNTSVSDNGLIKVYIDQNSDKVKVSYKLSKIQIVSNIVTVLSYILLFVYVLKLKLKKEI